jgi:hypothetical protein
MIGTILLMFAFVLLVLEGLSVPTPPRFKLGWIGLALWALSILIVTFHRP